MGGEGIPASDTSKIEAEPGGTDPRTFATVPGTSPTKAQLAQIVTEAAPDDRTKTLGKMDPRAFATVLAIISAEAPPSAPADPVNPAHYRGDRVMRIIEEFDLGFCPGNVVKYLLREREKGGVVDLKKARWYLDREIARRTATPASVDPVEDRPPTAPRDGAARGDDDLESRRGGE